MAVGAFDVKFAIRFGRGAYRRATIFIFSAPPPTPKPYMPDSDGMSNRIDR